MKLALVQMKMSENMEENATKSIAMIRKAADCGTELVCFPEIQLSPFFPQYEGRDASRYLLTMNDRYIQEMCAVCREVGIFACPNYYIEENGRRYDMSLLIDDQGVIIGRQKMVHVAQCSQFYEQDYYTPSEEGFAVYDTRLGKLGIVVCFDRHYPESIRTEALRGAELIIIPTANTKAEPSELFAWEIKVQAFQNSVNAAMCNRVGVEDGMAFSGESIVVDYNGDTVAVAGDSEELLITEVDMTGVSECRRKKPYTSLRRPELYE